MAYDNIKSHKKGGFHPLPRKHIFGKTTGGGGGSNSPPTQLRPATLLKKRLQYRCFPVNFANF